MSKERFRSIKSAQIKLRMIMVHVDGTAGTPAATSFDKFGVTSVTDLGAGSYRIIFNRPFARACKLAGWSTETAQRVVEVTATDVDRITVQCRDLAGVAADVDIFLTVVGSDSSYDI